MTGYAVTERVLEFEIREKQQYRTDKVSESTMTVNS